MGRKKWEYLKEGDTVQEGDLWCGCVGDNPKPTLACDIGSRVSKHDEWFHCFMRLREVEECLKRQIPRRTSQEVSFSGHLIS